MFAIICNFYVLSTVAMLEVIIKKDYLFILFFVRIPQLYYTANVLSAEIADECLQTKSTDNLQ